MGTLGSQPIMPKNLPEHGLQPTKQENNKKGFEDYLDKTTMDNISCFKAQELLARRARSKEKNRR
jgi:hypothetical protein